MDQILQFINSSLILDFPALVTISLLFILFIIQIYFYFRYYLVPVSYQKKNISVPDHSTDKLSVSVIIIARNESDNLEQLLPLILKQNYSNFELIVVNDGSTDESQYYVERLVKADPRVYYTFSVHEDLDSDRSRVLAMTIGIKAAKNDILLFTEPTCRPLSSNWIKSMIYGFEEGKDIVLGYNKLNVPKSFWGRVCRFDNLIFSLQSLSMAIKNKPYIGTYRNIAYRKSLFFDNKGFSSTLNFNNAEEVFLNRIMSKKNTAVIETIDSFTQTEIEDYRHWKSIKSIYSGVKKNLKGYTARRFSFEIFSRYLFYITFIAVLSYSLYYELWIYLIGSLFIFIARYLIQFLVLKSAAKIFETKSFCFSLFIMDLLQPLYNFSFFTYSRRK